MIIRSDEFDRFIGEMRIEDIHDGLYACNTPFWYSHYPDKWGDCSLQELLSNDDLLQKEIDSMNRDPSITRRCYGSEKQSKSYSGVYGDCIVSAYKKIHIDEFMWDEDERRIYIIDGVTSVDILIKNLKSMLNLKAFW